MKKEKTHKSEKSEVKWAELNRYFKTEINENYVNEYGLLCIVNYINDFRRKYGLESLKHKEIKKVLLEIENQIEKNLICYDENALLCLTYCITHSENQKSLFDYKQLYIEDLSPESYFLNNLFQKINQNENLNIDNICDWVVDYIKDIFKNNNVVDCCAYFLAFFVMLLIFNYDASKSCDCYAKIILTFHNCSEIKKLLYYIWYNILRNYISIKETYFQALEDDEEIYNTHFKKFQKCYDNETFTVPQTKINLNFCRTLSKIVYENCLSYDYNNYFNFYYVDVAVAKKIADVNKFDDFYAEKMKEIYKEIFV